jgi:hypothetical protein
MSTQPNRQQQLTYLRMIAGERAESRFFDVRWRRSTGPMRRRFFTVRALAEAQRTIALLAAANDVYVGVALRDADTHGGRASISGAQVLWVESDDPETALRLLPFEYPPAMAVASGSPGHLQLYWRVDAPCHVAALESANRRLALALSGDPASTDAARILRPPGTLNHKHDPPRRVEILAYRPGNTVTLKQLLKGLPPDPEPGSRQAGASPRELPRSPVDRALLAIPSSEYVRVLAGRTPNREGKVCCPFHQDSRPSLQLYPDGGFYCFGSGCGRGGTIFDFAAHLWDIPPRGAGFRELRRRLSERFAEPAAGKRVVLP